MSDPHDHDLEHAPDPVDKAYAEAEAVLSDEAERARRRARVLAAVARETEAPVAANTPGGWRPTWRRGGLLAAACVAGASLFLAVRLYQPALHPHPTTVATESRAQPAPQAGGVAASPHATIKASQEPRPKTFVAPAPAPVAPPAAAARIHGERRAAAPIVAQPQAFPAEAPVARSTVQEVVVTGSRAPRAAAAASASPVDKATAAENEDVAAAPPPPPPAPPPPAAFAAAPAVDLAASLGEAAAAGRTSEVEALLARGAHVDAADKDGNTALMKSVRADHPAVAAVLRRHGASLDRQNHAGESARDLAKAKHDKRLDKALGLVP
jgi:hypothetical protein